MPECNAGEEAVYNANTINKEVHTEVQENHEDEVIFSSIVLDIPETSDYLKIENRVKIIFKEKFVARVIEGCNAISIMILFAAFVFAFATQWKKTMLYIGIGIFLIHILNIIRIALLSFALYYYPKYEAFLHGTIFPLFIYGVVFILWVLWVTKFSGYVKRTTAK